MKDPQEQTVYCLATFKKMYLMFENNHLQRMVRLTNDTLLSNGHLTTSCVVQCTIARTKMHSTAIFRAQVSVFTL